MPSKKRKYNARFPAGRIKKIMQTDEEVGKVAQAVPIIIYLPRTLELFVESLLTKSMQVTTSRNAKTLSPSHVKQCILAESRFDFLRDLVKNIPDVSAAEEKEMISAENSPNVTRFIDLSIPPRRLAREDSNSSSSSDAKVQLIITPIEPTKQRTSPSENEPLAKIQKVETPTSTVVTPTTDDVMDLSKKTEEKSMRTPNFYQETLNIDKPEVQHGGVIRVNPIYGSIPQPSTSQLTITPLKPVQRIDVPKTPIGDYKSNYFSLDLRSQKNNTSKPPRTPVTPVLNIDFTKNLENPEIKVLDNTAAANIVGVTNETKNRLPLQRQNSKPPKSKKQELKRTVSEPIDIDHFNSGNLQIDEDYDT